MKQCTVKTNPCFRYEGQTGEESNLVVFTDSPKDNHVNDKLFIDMEDTFFLLSEKGLIGVTRVDRIYVYYVSVVAPQILIES